MNFNRVVGNICSALGCPFWVSVMGFYSGLKEKTPIQCGVCAITGIITLPLCPLVLIGENLLDKCDQEDFEKRTSHLPRIANSPSSEEAFIDQGSDNLFYVDPFYFQYKDDDYEEKGVFSSKEEAELFLISQGYEESIDPNREFHHLYGTRWIKDLSPKPRKSSDE